MLPPVAKITSSRGLSDAHITSIITDVQLMAEERLGGPVLFDLLEVSDCSIRVFYCLLILLQHVRDCLTDQNKPCGSCSICLSLFEVNILLIANNTPWDQS